MLRSLSAVLVAGLLPLLITPLVRTLAFKVGAVDKPEARKVHKEPMPRIGGIAIYIGFVVGVLILNNFTKQTVGLVVASSIVFATGLIDDLKDISPRLKLLGQLIGAIVLCSFGVYIKFLTNPFGGDIIFLDYWGIPLTIIWLVGISNAVNLIDGLDGLAAGVSGIAALTMAAVALTHASWGSAALALILAASCLGFLRWNFNPAKIFMGDSGSLFLGFVLGALGIMGFAKGATIISLFIPILILGIPIFDTMFAVIRRSVSGKPIFKADKGHLHHCLLNMGFSQRKTVLLIYAITAAMSFGAVLVSFLTNAQAVLILIGISVLTLVGAEHLGILRINKSKDDQEKDKKKLAEPIIKANQNHNAESKGVKH